MTPSPTKRALVLGITGQDAAYLAQLLLDKGYTVIGTSRDAATANRRGLQSLGIVDRVELLTTAITDFRSVLQTIQRARPDEIYHLAGQTSVGLSFDQPVETIESIALGTLNILEAMRFVDRDIHLYHAGSSECFGDLKGQRATEDTPFRPRSPYAVAKACALNLVANYREAYNLKACSGILFNHESPLRPERFVTQKIVYAAAQIALGRSERLELGNLDIHRDWGWAPEYVEAMWLMLQQAQPEDYVIATGRTVALSYFVSRVFETFGLDWTRHVVSNPTLLRPSDIQYGAANPERARERLKWQATKSVDDVVAALCEAAMNRLKTRTEA